MYRPTPVSVSVQRVLCPRGPSGAPCTEEIQLNVLCIWFCHVFRVLKGKTRVPTNASLCVAYLICQVMYQDTADRAVYLV